MIDLKNKKILPFFILEKVKIFKNRKKFFKDSAFYKAFVGEHKLFFLF